jgi:hypothetical protein
MCCSVLLIPNLYTDYTPTARTPHIERADLIIRGRKSRYFLQLFDHDLSIIFPHRFFSINLSAVLYISIIYLFPIYCTSIEKIPFFLRREKLSDGLEQKRMCCCLQKILAFKLQPKERQNNAALCTSSHFNEELSTDIVVLFVLQI